MKLNDALGGLLTYKLAGEDAIRQSGVPYTVVRPCALTEEPVGAPLELDQGDRIKVLQLADFLLAEIRPQLTNLYPICSLSVNVTLGHSLCPSVISSLPS